MWNAVIFRRVPTRGEVKWLHHDVYQRSRDSGSNLRDQLGPAMADRSPPCWVGLDSAYWGVPIMGDVRRQLSNTAFCRFLCVHVQFGVFPTSTLWCLSWFSCLADLLWALGHFQLFPHIHGGPHPFSFCECTNSYFLLLENFARVRKKTLSLSRLNTCQTKGGTPLQSFGMSLWTLVLKININILK